jgi:predicted lipoprotein with Yx(FWY)xxD motif
MTTFHNWRSAAGRAWIPAVGGMAAIALAVAGCGGSSGGSKSAYGSVAPAKSGNSAAPTANPTAASVTLAHSKLGKILVDGSGQTLYLFQADKSTASTCSGACASVWPPAVTKGPPVAGPGVSASKLGTTKRSDGTTEITYNGHPLYTYAGDTSPGQTTGEGNPGFGAEWDVLSAAGNKVEIGS